MPKKPDAPIHLIIPPDLMPDDDCKMPDWFSGFVKAAGLDAPRSDDIDWSKVQTEAKKHWPK